MGKRLVFAILAVLTVGALGAGSTSCNDATSLRVVITTDFPCPTFLATEVSIARPAEGIDSDGSLAPLRTTTACAARFVGDVVVTPSEDHRDSTVGIRVLTKLSPEATCIGADKRCIVAKRRVRFLEHAELAIPIRLSESCAGVVCGAAQTCDLGVCVSDAIDCNAASCGPVDGATVAPLPVIEAGAAMPDAGKPLPVLPDGGDARERDAPLLGPSGAILLGSCKVSQAQQLGRAGGGPSTRLSEMVFVRSQGEGHLLWAADTSLYSTPTETTDTPQGLPAAETPLATAHHSAEASATILSVAASGALGFWLTEKRAAYRRLQSASFTNELPSNADEQLVQVVTDASYVHWSATKDGTTTIRSARLADLLPDDPRPRPPLAYVETRVPAKVERMASAGTYLFAATPNAMFRLRRGSVAPAPLFTSPSPITAGPALQSGLVFFASSGARVRAFDASTFPVAYADTVETSTDAAVELAVGGDRLHYVRAYPQLDDGASCADDTGVAAQVGKLSGREKLRSRGTSPGGLELSSACRLERGERSVVVDGQPHDLVAAGITHPVIDDVGCAYYQTHGESAAAATLQQIHRISTK